MRALLALVPALVAPAQPQPALAPELTPDQAVQLWQRVGALEPFLDSAEARSEPQSLYRFFNRADYAKLKGNPVLGYFSRGGFRWAGDRVAWLGIRPATPDATPISAKAWDAAFLYLARKRNWVVDAHAPIRISGACVGAVLEPSPDEPYRGVCVEVRVASPQGTLLYRFSVAKPAIEDAIGASLDWVLCCAGTFDQAPGKEAQHGTPQP